MARAQKMITRGLGNNKKSTLITRVPTGFVLSAWIGVGHTSLLALWCKEGR